MKESLVGSIFDISVSNRHFVSCFISFCHFLGGYLQSYGTKEYERFTKALLLSDRGLSKRP